MSKGMDRKKDEKKKKTKLFFTLDALSSNLVVSNGHGLCELGRRHGQELGHNVQPVAVLNVRGLVGRGHKLNVSQMQHSGRGAQCARTQKTLI